MSTTIAVQEVRAGDRFKLDGETSMIASQNARLVGEKVVLQVVGGILKVHRSVLAELFF